MQQHNYEARRLYRFGTAADSYAHHMAKQVPQNTKATDLPNFICPQVSILWQGNPLSVVKTFGSRDCKLCMKERFEILRAKKKDPNKLINRCNEIYGACRHKPRFHRFEQKTFPGTDESNKDERVYESQSRSQSPTPPLSTMSTMSTSSTGSTLSHDSRGSQQSCFETREPEFTTDPIDLFDRSKFTANDIRLNSLLARHRGRSSNNKSKRWERRVPSIHAMKLRSDSTVEDVYTDKEVSEELETNARWI